MYKIRFFNGISLHVKQQLWGSSQLARSVGFVSRQKSRFYGLHARRAREAPHQPVVDALDVVSVHTRQVTNRIADHKLHHAYDTPERFHMKLSFNWYSFLVKFWQPVVKLSTHSRFFLHPSYVPVGKCWMRPIRLAIFTCSSSVSCEAALITFGDGWYSGTVSLRGKEREPYKIQWKAMDCLCVGHAYFISWWRAQGGSRRRSEELQISCGLWLGKQRGCLTPSLPY